MANPTPGAPPWFNVLEAARKLSPRESQTFTAAQLADEAGIGGTDKSRPSQIAAAWLSKFMKWGYVNFAGKVDAGGIRQSNSYAVTKLGRECEVTEGCPARLVRLITAVRVFEKSRSTPREGAAYKALLQVTGDLEG